MRCRVRGVDIRRDGKECVTSSAGDPAKPIVGVAVIGDTVLEVPVVTGVGEVAPGVVGRDGITTPAGNRDAELLDVGSRLREVDAIDERGNSPQVADGDGAILHGRQYVNERDGTVGDGQVPGLERVRECEIGDSARRSVGRNV